MQSVTPDNPSLQEMAAHGRPQYLKFELARVSESE